MKQSFVFPTDIVTFGKYYGKTIAYVIDTDKSYYDWAISQGLNVSELITDYYNGKCIVNEKISSKVNRRTNTLQIFKSTFYLLPKKKFVRAKDLVKIINKEIISECKITVPFKTQTVTVTHNWLGEGIQHDDIHLSSTREITVKEYDKELLEKFIQEKLKENFVV